MLLDLPLLCFEEILYTLACAGYGREVVCCLCLTRETAARQSAALFAGICDTLEAMDATQRIHSKLVDTIDQQWNRGSNDYSFTHPDTISYEYLVSKRITNIRKWIDWKLKLTKERKSIPNLGDKGWNKKLTWRNRFFRYYTEDGVGKWTHTLILCAACARVEGELRIEMVDHPDEVRPCCRCNLRLGICDDSFCSWHENGVGEQVGLCKECRLVCPFCKRYLCLECEDVAWCRNGCGALSCMKCFNPDYVNDPRCPSTKNNPHSFEFHRTGLRSECSVCEYDDDGDLCDECGLMFCSNCWYTEEHDCEVDEDDDGGWKKTYPNGVPTHNNKAKKKGGKKKKK